MNEPKAEIVRPAEPTLEELIISEYRRPRPLYISLSRLALFFSKHLLLIAAVTLAGTVALTALSFLLPDTYTASVLLVYSPPAKSLGILQEGRLPIEYYASLATALPLVQNTIERARQQKLLPPGCLITDENFTARILTREVDRSKEKLPLLVLEVSAPAPALARDLANNWVDALIDSVHTRGEQQLGNTVGLLLDQARENQAKILEVQNAILETEAHHRRQADAIALRMDSRIRTFQAQHPIDLWQKQLAQKKEQLLKLHDDLFLVEQNIERATQQVKQYREQLESQPPVYTLAQSFITNEALWENLGRADSPLDISALKDLQLKSEHLNPVHTELLTKLINAQVTLNTLIPFREFGRGRAAGLEQEIRELGDRLNAKQSELQTLENLKQQELQHNANEQKRKSKELGLRQQSYQEYFDGTARSFGEAENLQRAKFSEIMVAAAASTPFAATRPKRLSLALFAACASFLLALLAAAVVEMKAQSH